MEKIYACTCVYMYIDSGKSQNEIFWFSVCIVIAHVCDYFKLLNIPLFLSCTFKINVEVFADVFEELCIFAVIMDLFQTSVKCLLFQTLTVKLKIKIYGNDRMSSKFYVSPNNYRSPITRARLNTNTIKIIKIRRLFCSWLTFRKCQVFRLRRLVIPLLTKILIIYLKKKMVILYPNSLCNF